MFHPEARPSEVWLTNIGMEEDIYGGKGYDYEDFDDIGWKTKRIGERAYDINGNLIDAYPVFVERCELEQAGIIVPGQERWSR